MIKKAMEVTCEKCTGYNPLSQFSGLAAQEAKSTTCKSLRFTAFTLIELLMSIAIITILAAFLFPVLNKVKAKAQEINCVNNLKQSGLAILMYAQDNNGYAFLFTSWTGPSSEKGWSDVLYDGEYIKSKNTFLCPSWSPYQYTSHGFTYGVEFGDISLSTYPVIINSNTRFRNLSKIDFPSKRIALADSIWAPINPNYPKQTWVLMPASTNSSVIHLRHRKRANTFFWDGHVVGSGRSELKTSGFSGALDLNGNTVSF